MDDLFDFVSDDTRMFNALLDAIKKLAGEVVLRLGHKEGTIRIEENVTKNEINYPVSIAESPYVFGKDNLGADATLTPILTLVKTTERSRNPHCVEIRLNQSNVAKFAIPEGSTVKEKYTKDDQTGEKKLASCSVYVKLDCVDLPGRIEDLLQKALEGYRSSVQPAFGCCDRYQECSDAGHCVHPNRLYASVCTYRQRIVEGKIFYGEKRNV